MHRATLDSRHNAEAVAKLDELLNELVPLSEETELPPERPLPTLFDREPSDAEQQLLASKIMLIDDEPINIKLARKYLMELGYSSFVMVTESHTALDIMRQQKPDVVLLDVMMPDVSGLDILSAMKRDPELHAIPVVVLTATTDRSTRLTMLDLGATDFLSKPVDLAELAPRVRNALTVRAFNKHLRHYAQELESAVKFRTMQLARARTELVHCLARAAEFRDDDTGRHVIRVGRYAGVIARQAGLTEAFSEMIESAAQLHDVGKIGIPDSILLKPGKLTPDEFERMQKHCGYGKRVLEIVSSSETSTLKYHAEIGARILRVAQSPLTRMAASIALTHHEKWNGSGYPLGLSGTDIPIEGRVTAIADVFDALSSKRPYKPAFPLEKCLAIMQDGRGIHFDPDLLDAFFAARNQIIAIQLECADID